MEGLRANARRHLFDWGGGGGYPDNGLFGEASPERGT